MYYKSEIKITILSQEKLGDMTLREIDYAITYGECSGHLLTTLDNEEVDSATMAILLQEQGSDPAFFGLDEEGNRLEDLEEEELNLESEKNNGK